MNLRILEQQPAVRSYWDVRDQLKRHIYGRSLEAFARGDAARDAIRTPAALAARQRTIRREFLRGIGGLPPVRGPVPSRGVGAVRGHGFRIEKIIFESRPRTWVTANLYVPDGVAAPRGAVLFLCGHHEQAKHAGEYQSVCQTLVQAGLVVLAQDPVGQGERFSYPEAEARRRGINWGCPEHDYAGAQCLPLGDAMARWFLHDAMRGLDYLASRPEVDARRIGVTGNSGGGTQTSMVMLGDPRIAAAAPTTFVMNRETYMWSGGAQDAEQIWPGFTAAGLDHEDILLAMCPKPVRVLAVKSDFFPIEGTRRTVERCRRIWKLRGKPSHLDLVEDPSIHRYTPRLAEAAAEFFARHLLGVHGVRKPRISVFPPSRLWCTRSGQVMGELPGARSVHHENRDRLCEVLASRRADRSAALAWLRKKVFGPRKRCALNPRFIPPERVGELEAEQAFWWSQAGLLNHGLLFRVAARHGKRLPVTLAIWNGGTSVLRPHASWIRTQCRAGRAVLVLDVSGAGALQPNSLNLQPVVGFYGVLHKFADDLLWLGDDLAALRAYDVLRALDVLGEWPSIDARRIALYGHGQHGVYAQLAAAIDPRVNGLRVEKGLGSYAALVAARHYDHRDIKSVILRGILHCCDLPDLARWQNQGVKRA